MDANEFCHCRVLPVVLAFAAGVIAMDFAAEHQERHELDALRERVRSMQQSLAESVQSSGRYQHMAHYAIERAGQCMEQLAIQSTPMLSAPIRMVRKGSK